MKVSYTVVVKRALTFESQADSLSTQGHKWENNNTNVP